MSILLNGVSGGYLDFKVKDISTTITEGSFTVLIGPNGCGKSTLLNIMARVLAITSGTIHIEGKNIGAISSRKFAQTLSVLPQIPIVPPAIQVEQLVAYGRAPHQNLLGIRSQKDDEAIEEALLQTEMTALRHRLFTELSGGQRQRAFIAMCLAQNTPYVLFDEPTSFLDIRHQYETLDLISNMRSIGFTCIVVLHDINQAARYADHLIVMHQGAIKMQGRPKDVMSPALIQNIYGLAAKVYLDPVSQTPVMTPLLNGN